MSDAPSAAPRVSVLLPVRDGAAHLSEAIECVLADRFGDFELLVIDDGSRDASPEIALAFAARDARVAVLRQPAQGLVAALNAGLSLARGEYVARMDADDRSRPERLTRQIAYLDAHPECAAVGCAYLEIDEQGWPICERKPPETHAAIEAVLLSGLAGVLPHAACVFRRSALEQLGTAYRDCPEAEDLDLYLRLAERGRLANLPELLFEVRRHAQSTTRTRSGARAAALKLELAGAARARRGLPPLEPAEPDLRELGPAEHLAITARRALGAGHRATARKHSARALRLRPTSPAAWRVWLVCRLRRG